MWCIHTDRFLGNVLIYNFITAVLAEGESWLAYTTVTKHDAPIIVVRPLYNNGTDEVIIQVPGSIADLTFDFEDKKVYWCFDGANKFVSGIHRANLDGTGIENVIHRLDGATATAIAFDWITKSVYFIDASDEKIGTCDPSSKLCAILVQRKGFRPYKIALDPLSGIMVWTALIDEYDNWRTIFKASMDGSNPIRIKAAKGASMHFVTIDQAHSLIYWIKETSGAIYTMDLNGSNLSSFESIGNISIRAMEIDVGGQDIYWIDLNEGSLKKCKKGDGSSFGVIPTGFTTGLAGQTTHEICWIGFESQPNHRINHCENHTCSYICVLTETSFRCLCPPGIPLSQNGDHCEDVGPQMVISTDAGLHVLSMTTRKIQKISNLSFSSVISYDFENSKIYWVGGTSFSTIFRSNLNGFVSESVVTISGGERITGLVYDWIAHNIYYTRRDHVGVCDGSGRNCAILFRNPKQRKSGIVLFPHSALMLWVTEGIYTSITCANMDGSAAETKWQENSKELYNNLVVDNENFQLFWLYDSTKIVTSDLNFKTFRDYSPKLKNLKSIAVGGQFLYWMNDNIIERSDKQNYAELGTFKNLDWNETVFEMRLFHRDGQLQDRINHCAHSRCSHLCVLTEKYFRCICPPELYMMRDGQTCTEHAREYIKYRPQAQGVASSYEPRMLYPEDDNGARLGYHDSCKQWICANEDCVTLADVCNGTLGCSDGTDEGWYCDMSCKLINRTDDGKDCVRTPSGPQILCPHGFQNAADEYTCEDIDECLGNKTVCPEKECFNTNGSYECRVIPAGDNDRASPFEIAVAAAIPTVFAIVLSGVVWFFGVKYYKFRKILRRLTPEEVQEFLDGDETAASTADYGADKARLLPFRLIIQPDSIIIDKNAILGRGQFGIVYQGFYDAEAVAVKTFKRTVEIDDFKAVLTEAKIMAYIGDHVHIIRFIGADVSNIADRKLVLVTELSPHGDLAGYLTNINPTKWTENNGCKENNESSVVSVTPGNLVSWCEQIAYGMQHLEDMKIVHGDLAARNVLVFQDNVVKIADFGLSKQLYGKSQYLLKPQRLLPWEFCAIELLLRREFSTDSDIWAFGVTAWEIFSLGLKPYDTFEFGMEFINHLQEGNRLPQPTFATTEIFEILQECWRAERSSRPRFTTLREFFRKESTISGMNNHVMTSMTNRVSNGYEQWSSL